MYFNRRAFLHTSKSEKDLCSPFGISPWVYALTTDPQQLLVLDGRLNIIVWFTAGNLRWSQAAQLVEIRVWIKMNKSCVGYFGGTRRSLITHDVYSRTHTHTHARPRHARTRRALSDSVVTHAAGMHARTPEWTNAHTLWHWHARMHAALSDARWHAAARTHARACTHTHTHTHTHLPKHPGPHLHPHLHTQTQKHYTQRTHYIHYVPTHRHTQSCRPNTHK